MKRLYLTHLLFFVSRSYLFMSLIYVFLSTLPLVVWHEHPCKMSKNMNELLTFWWTYFKNQWTYCKIPWAFFKILDFFENAWFFSNWIFLFKLIIFSVAHVQPIMPWLCCVRTVILYIHIIFLYDQAWRVYINFN